MQRESMELWYPVSSSRSVKWSAASDTHLGTAHLRSAAGRHGSPVICRCFKLWCGLYLTDRRPERTESYGGGTDHEPGIRHCHDLPDGSPIRSDF